jgi:hypothetical protein
MVHQVECDRGNGIMSRIMDFPLFVFAISFLAMWLSVRLGSSFRRWRRPLEEDEREDFRLVLGSTLTLLGLIIGFTFSMAVSRYDQRKNYEEAEANAIGTEYVRADLLPAADAARVRTLLRNYLDQRILFYVARDDRELIKVNASTARLQNDLWLAAQAPASARPTPVIALAVSGMNDLLNSEGYTQFAWGNRIPLAAWSLMGAITVCCHLLVGYGARRSELKAILFIVLPFVVSISFFLIADIDSPRHGVIRVRPQNLEILAQSLRSN